MWRAIPREGKSRHQSQGHCWERQPWCAVFRLPLNYISMGLGPGTLPYQEIKGPYRLCCACCFVLEISFSISDSICTTLFCLNMCQMAHGPLLYRFPTGRAWVPSIAFRRDLLGMVGPMLITEVALALCHFIKRFTALGVPGDFDSKM